MNCGESKVKMTLSRLRLQLKGVLERGLFGPMSRFSTN